MVTIYGRAGCGACAVTRRHLELRHVPFAYVELSAPGALRRALEELPAAATTADGHLPIVTLTDPSGQLTAWWNGYRPQSLDAIAAAHQPTL